MSEGKHTVPDTIQAAVDPAAIGKVSRFFDASTGQIVNEMLQNARRAGATKVKVTTPRDNLLRLTDNGRGIGDPRALLAFGRSDWDGETVKAEDPVGMGVFSLARREARIASRPPAAGQGVADAWEVYLEPDHFLGLREAAIGVCRDAPAPHGTIVEFEMVESSTSASHILSDAARYYPLEVSFNGRDIPREDFLEKAVRVEEWSGVRIGVFHERRKGWYHCQINFHGHQIDCPLLPIVTALEDQPDVLDTWWIRIDVIDGAQLELVLPARTQVVQNNFVNELKQACERAIFRTIEALPETPSLGHHTWARAHELGIKLAAAKPRLRGWLPRTADDYDRHHTRFEVLTPLPDDTETVLVMKTKAPTGDEQALWRALASNLMLGRVFDKDDNVESYGWYRKLDRIVRIDFRVEYGDGRKLLLGEARTAHEQMTDENPRRIVALVTVESADGNERVLELDTDVAFWSPEATCPEEIEMLITADSDVDAKTLTNMMVDAFFYPTEDVDSDSPVTQRAQFTRKVREKALRRQMSGVEARRATIADLVEHHLVEEIDRAEDVTIHIQDGKATVTIAETGRAA